MASSVREKGRRTSSWPCVVELELRSGLTPKSITPWRVICAHVWTMMASLEKVGRVYVLTLTGEGDHRLDEHLMRSILSSIQVVADDPDAGALVTTNQGRFFSNGLDLDWVRANAHEDLRSDSYHGLLAALLNLNVPTVAVICGHACGSGCVFALAHDHRFMGADRGFLYMNELDLSHRISSGMLGVLRSALSTKAIKECLLLARKLTAAEAHGLGMVDSVVRGDAAATLEAAVKFAADLSGRDWNREVYRNFRLDVKPELLDSLLDVGRPMFLAHRSKL